MSKRVIIISYVVLGLLFIFNIFVIVYISNSNKTENIYEDNIMKVVEIKTTNDETSWGYATGFFIDSNGTILTNKHVVYNSTLNNDYNIIQVRLVNNNEWLSAQVVKISETDDLALIKIEKSNTHFFKLGKSISNGQPIYTIGNPNGFGLSFTKGIISSNDRNVIYNGQTIKTIQTSLVINEGNSGGPIFDKKGNLLGIISFRLKDKYSDVIQGVSFTLPIGTINSFIKN